MLKRWVQPAGILALVLLYLGLWAFASLQITNPTDFDAFFLPSAKIALSGHPFDIYQVRYEGLYPNANGPLSTLPLTIVAALAEKLGILNDSGRCRMLVAVAFAVFPLLLSREALLTLDLLLKSPLRGVRRLLAFAVFALCPELWHSILGYGHIEHALMLFLLLAGVRSLMLRRTSWAGVLLGLALLTRSSAVLYLIPLTMLLLAERNWWRALRFAGCALATLALGLLPFALADRADLIYSLVTFHGLLPVGGGSIWGVVASAPLKSLGDHYDTVFVIGASLLLSPLLLLCFRNLRLGSGDIYALLAVSGLCFPLLLKTLWPYYYLDSYMLLALWWLSSARPLPNWGARMRWLLGAALPLSTVLAGELSEYGLDSSEGSWTAAWSLTMTILTLSMMVMIISILWFKSRLRTQRGLQAEGAPQATASALQLQA
ncbi:MAG: hypothetical protein ACLQUY_01440 [Ktedonobacterales bacterium]